MTAAATGSRGSGCRGALSCSFGVGSSVACSLWKVASWAADPGLWKGASPFDSGGSSSQSSNYPF